MPTFDTPEPISVSVEPGVGNVQVVASDRTDTVVEVTPSDPAEPSDVKAAEQTRVDFAGGTLSVKGPRISPFDITKKTRSIEVRIELPAGSTLHGKTGMGDLHVTGRLGECRFRSGTGHIQLDRTGDLNVHSATGNVTAVHVAGNAEISTSSGRVQVGGIEGTGTVKNSNGATTIGAVTGSLRVRSANGDIVVEEATESVNAKTANGAVRVLDAVRGALTLDTAMGEIEIGIRQGSAAWLDVKTHFGRVLNDLADTSEPGATTDRIEVHANTAFGDITVHRS
jgi:DUF4097 and DUF4098 domain-containing protein YvlB